MFSIFRKFFAFFIFILAFFLISAFSNTDTLHAQVIGPVPSPTKSIQQNGVSNMAAIGDTLWIGPGLNRNIGNANEWYKPEKADSVVNGRGRLYSISVAVDTVIGALGYTSTGDNVQTGLGYEISTDGGANWDFQPLPLDQQEDTTFVYGGKTYQKLAVTVPQQSAPFGIDHKDNVIFSASWASGIVRSTDFGQTWQRLVLPPDRAAALNPENEYSYQYQDQNGVTHDQYNPRYFNNLLGFEVMVDQAGNVWAGTAAGVNISPNALTAPVDSIRWEHITFDGSPTGLMGNWVITIKQQPQTHKIWMTNWIASSNRGERYGIVATADTGKTFTHYLEGQKINDISFRGNTIFAAGDNGLFVSPDGGKSWKKYGRIQSPNTFIKASARKLSVAATTDRVWVGTDDGLASTNDQGKSWEITRVDFPLQGGNQYQSDASDVDTYAYPNPFSPTQHQYVRIKFDVKREGNVKIELYDFGMNKIRELENNTFSKGTYEAVWDGTDAKGRRVANGTVFYRVIAPGHTAKGKILVLD